MKTVMFYEVSPEGMAKAREVYPRHRARLDEFHAKGSLLMAGPFADPAEGALGIFASREAAEDFVRGDPFVLEGVVKAWRLLDWREVLAE